MSYLYKPWQCPPCAIHGECIVATNRVNCPLLLSFLCRLVSWAIALPTSLAEQQLYPHQRDIHKCLVSCLQLLYFWNHLFRKANRHVHIRHVVHICTCGIVWSPVSAYMHTCISACVCGKIPLTTCAWKNTKVCMNAPVWYWICRYMLTQATY